MRAFLSMMAPSMIESEPMPTGGMPGTGWRASRPRFHSYRRDEQAVADAGVLADATANADDGAVDVRSLQKTALGDEGVVDRAVL